MVIHCEAFSHLDDTWMLQGLLNLGFSQSPAHRILAHVARHLRVDLIQLDCTVAHHLKVEGLVDLRESTLADQVQQLKSVLQHRVVTKARPVFRIHKVLVLEIGISLGHQPALALLDYGVLSPDVLLPVVAYFSLLHQVVCFFCVGVRVLGLNGLAFGLLRQGELEGCHRVPLLLKLLSKCRDGICFGTILPFRSAIKIGLVSTNANTIVE
mmetsp:Transcript_66241/g.155182  ORF Transcript_66241/g.155182 Transcript_66241/m.155182 type:complete len:211 (+) Transcript_66241:682-1314(+)